MNRAESREAQQIQNSRGKWGEKGVPHKGWTCIEIEDLGSPAMTCEMCESQEIRYAHHMQHSSYANELVVGCICAGHMENNLAAARSRDARMRSRVSKRRRWLGRRWKVSAKGNPWIESDGYRVTVYKKGAGWGATVSAVNDSYLRHGRRVFESADRAKLAAFDLVTSLLAKTASTQ